MGKAVIKWWEEHMVVKGYTTQISWQVKFEALFYYSIFKCDHIGFINF